MSKIIGLDLGTNSIGWSIRNTNLSENQIEKSGVVVFKKGVGRDKSGEYSFASQRTQKRSMRRLYQARKYRLLSTLKCLVNSGYCPLNIDSLNAWKNYKKPTGESDSGYKYPKDDIEFNNWIKLDFDGDGKPDFKSPFQLRKFLAEEKLDFSIAKNKYMLGRAIYHIAQRRGFKSSRKSQGEESELENNNGEIDIQLSEKKKSKLLTPYWEKYPNAKTIGVLLANLENEGLRIRSEILQYVVREDYKNELKFIFEFQGFGLDSELFKEIVESEVNKNDGTVFFKRPLRSQKGLIGLCTLEQKIIVNRESGKSFEAGKKRAPISHPQFELFRAWQFLNNIKYLDLDKNEREFTPLDLEIKNEILEAKFYRKSKPYFQFSEIIEYFKKQGKNWELNYKPNQSIAACPVSARLREIFGNKFMSVKLAKPESPKMKKDYYDIEDIWHVLFSFEDVEYVSEFAAEKLKLSIENVQKFISTWNIFPVGYSMLSLNAINKINRFLIKGIPYNDAVLLANLPDLIGEDKWQVEEDNIMNNLSLVLSENRMQKQIIGIVNTLIAKYKNLDQKFGYKDNTYLLSESDFQDIQDATLEFFGNKTWLSFDATLQEKILNTIKDCYQFFFRTTGLERVDINGVRYFKLESHDTVYYKSDTGFFKVPKIKDSLSDFINKNYGVSKSKLGKIYHHSDTSIYPPAIPNENGEIILGSPKTGSFKNPMAMRTLHELRKLLNYLIQTQQIDSETRVIVEVGRSLNDSNMRWAIEKWQQTRQKENEEFALAIKELIVKKGVAANSENDNDIDKFRLWYEQNGEEYIPELSDKKKNVKGVRWHQVKKESLKEIENQKDIVDKYRLWLEQKCICLYTGRVIGITDLFDENLVDFEHTIPRSISFDNSLANRTVAYQDYNRKIKRNKIPYNLPQKDYEDLLFRLKPWEEKLDRIKQQIEYWKFKSKVASEKAWKDDAIRQKHLWMMEYDYWHNKINRFKVKEITAGFKNSQLVDMQLISKYAFHYLKSYFEKVEVQKGSVTALFRKMLGIQSSLSGAMKDRSMHSHHAVDATVLTLIPLPAKREELLASYFEAKEKNVKFEPYIPYKGFSPSIINKIQDLILVKHIDNSQFLSNTKKWKRKRGKLQYSKDSDQPQVATGDTIRGQLHLETFYGAIKLPERDEQGKILRDENHKIVQQEKLTFTQRKSFVFSTKASEPGYKSWEEIEKDIYDEGLKSQIKMQIENAGGLKEAFEQGIYMLDKAGNKVNKIRHVKTIASKIKKPLAIKKHGNLSEKEYKQYYYAANATNCYFAIYEHPKLKKYIYLNLFDVATLKRNGLINNEKSFFSPTIFEKKGKVEHELKLKYVLKPGISIIFLKENECKDELKPTDVIKRLYIFNSYETDGRLNLTYHLEAREKDKINEAYKDSEIDWEHPKPKLRFGYSKYNFLVEGYDFEIQIDGSVKW